MVREYSYWIIRTISRVTVLTACRRDRRNTPYICIGRGPGTRIALLCLTHRAISLQLCQPAGNNLTAITRIRISAGNKYLTRQRHVGAAACLNQRADNRIEMPLAKRRHDETIVQKARQASLALDSLLNSGQLRVSQRSTDAV